MRVTGCLLVIAFLGMLPGLASGANAFREKEDTSWAAQVLKGQGAITGATAWKMAETGNANSATRMEQARAGTSRFEAAEYPAERVYIRDSYLSVRRSDLPRNKVPTSKQANYSRLIPAEADPVPLKKVIVGKVPSGTRKVAAFRMNSSDEYGPGSTVVAQPQVVKAVLPPAPPLTPAVAMGSTRSVAAAKPVSSTQMTLPGMSPVATPPVASGGGSLSPPVSRPAANVPPSSRNSASSFMASRKPAPVEEEPLKEEKPVPKTAKPTGVNIAPDAQGGYLSEMVVVSPSGRTIRMTNYLWAKRLLSEGDFTAADKQARDWLENYPDDWRGWQLLGNIQVELGAYNKALNSYKKSLKIHPDNPALRHYVDQAEGVEE